MKTYETKTGKAKTTRAYNGQMIPIEIFTGSEGIDREVHQVDWSDLFGWEMCEEAEEAAAYRAKLTGQYGWWRSLKNVKRRLAAIRGRMRRIDHELE